LTVLHGYIYPPRTTIPLTALRGKSVSRGEAEEQDGPAARRSWRIARRRPEVEERQSPTADRPSR
jgi:hypothetical protein